MAKKTVHFSSEKQKEFYRVFQEITERHSAWAVWSDWVEVTAIVISVPFEFRESVRTQRGERMQSIMKEYTAQEQQLFDRLFMILVDALEELPEQDFLGVMFSALHLMDHWKGQFFTPYDVARIMGEITAAGLEERLKDQSWTSVLDPCSGAGVLLIALRNYAVEHHIGADQILYVGQDVDQTAALMGYIQLSLLGCAGYIAVGNSLLHPVVSVGQNGILPLESPHYELWFTPIYRSQSWELRRCIALLNNNKVNYNGGD